MDGRRWVPPSPETTLGQVQGWGDSEEYVQYFLGDAGVGNECVNGGVTIKRSVTLEMRS